MHFVFRSDIPTCSFEHNFISPYLLEKFKKFEQEEPTCSVEHKFAIVDGSSATAHDIEGFCLGKLAHRLIVLIV
ncbi:hypothetical protein ES288_D09G207300v1 [Gossypium darwinii]|uniref:Uncharacterized protein n=1 Tax=Gossypium darwinii TaxID=34276 RepID=A0A5D2BDR9_GOSDA|nr:hypothetical protein ES288_D09G207300v1 [Gossypium darwinii]